MYERTLASWLSLDIATAEDVILSKLRWDNQLGGSDQQRRDIRNILKTAADQLDLRYIRKHAKLTRQTFESLSDEVNLNADQCFRLTDHPFRSKTESPLKPKAAGKPCASGERFGET